MRLTTIFIAFIFSLNTATAQDYFLENNGPYDNNIQSPEEYLGYEIGFEHTRHDLIVAYLKYLSNVSEKAQLIKYGESHEGRDLIMLTVSSTENLNNLEKIKNEHLKHTVPGTKTKIDSSLPIIVNLGYGVHGNEPSSAEAAILAAYTLVASKNNKVTRLIQNSVFLLIQQLTQTEEIGIHNGQININQLILLQIVMMLSIMKHGQEAEQITIGLI